MKKRVISLLLTLLMVLSMLGGFAISAGAETTVSVDIENDLKWLGRTYVSEDQHFFNWSNAGFEFNIDGTGATALLTSNCPETNQAYLKVYVDGEHTNTIQLTQASMTVALAENLPDGPHTIKVIKRTNGESSTAALKELWLDEGTEILPKNKVASRKMQFIGDSIAVGYGSMDWLKPTKWTTDSEDGSITYTALTSQYFGADSHTIAISGKGIIANYDNTDPENRLPFMYEFTDWNLKTPSWDHSSYQPDVIVINLGTNDSMACGITGHTKLEFKAAAKKFVQQVRSENPDAQIIYAYGFMDELYTAEVEGLVADLNAEGDSKVHYLQLPFAQIPNDRCLGHPTSAVHADRAQLLIAKVNEITGWEEHTECVYDANVVNEVTDLDDGYVQYTCQVCGDYYEEILPATGEHIVDVNGVTYPNLTKAAAAAKAGETITLLEDATVDHVVVNPGVVFDLNGNTLTVDYLVGFNSSVIYNGKVVVDKNKVALDKNNNGYLPVYDGKAYEFITVSTQEMTQVEGEDNVYYFLPDLVAVHESMLAGAENSGVKIIVRLSWTDMPGNYTATQDYVYMDEMVSEVIDSHNGAEYKKVFTAAFNGTEAGTAQDLKITAVVVSDTGVEIQSSGISFDTVNE